MKSRALVLYPDSEMRTAVSHTIAIETSRGWRLAEEKTSHKIDMVVAQAMACWGANKFGPETKRRDLEHDRMQALMLRELRRTWFHR